MTEGQKLSGYIGRDLTERELSEQWERIEGRLAAKRPVKAFRLAAALAVVLGVAVAVFVSIATGGRSPPRGTEPFSTAAPTTSRWRSGTVRASS